MENRVNSSNLLRGEFGAKSKFHKHGIEILKVAEIGEAIILGAKSWIRHHLVERYKFSQVFEDHTFI